MSFSIPSGIFQTYENVANELIDNVNIGKDILLIYPPKLDTNPSPGPDLIKGGTNSIFDTGGPRPWGPVGGTGLKDTEASETIRVRLYDNPQDWTRFTSIHVPEARLFIIGYVKDLPKINKAKTIDVLQDEKNYGRFKFVLANQPFFWGLQNAGRHKYFSVFLKRA